MLNSRTGICQRIAFPRRFSRPESRLAAPGTLWAAVDVGIGAAVGAPVGGAGEGAAGATIGGRGDPQAPVPHVTRNKMSKQNRIERAARLSRISGNTPRR
jgi:hypothetical protein